MRFKCLLALVMVCRMGAAEASPRFVHLSWSAPDASTGMTVTWMSDSVEDSSIVQYGVQDVTENEVAGTAFMANDALGAVHSVALSPLEPSTKYLYRVGGPEGGWSGTFEMTTGPIDGCGIFRFAAFGDNRPDVEFMPQLHWHPVLEETAQTEPAFFVHTGDIVKAGDDTNQWNTFFENSEPYLSYIPLMPSIGNHDDGPGNGDSMNYNQVFELPRNDVSGTEDYYYFVYGNAIVVSLSTQTLSDGDPPFSVQAQWLDKVLSENPAKWKFVFFHHPPYTSHQKFDLIFTEVEFNHPPNENGQNEALIPIFDKHHVDIAFFGHNHYYERFSPMTAGAAPEQGNPVASFDQGTVYVITGGAGAFVYDEFNILGINIDLIDWVCGEATGSEVCAGDLHYVTIEINDNVLHYEAWATMEQTLGNSPDNKKLLDTFNIIKEETPECSAPRPVEEANTPDVVEEPAVVEESDDVTTQADASLEVVQQDSAGEDAGAVDSAEKDKTGQVPETPEVASEDDGSGKDAAPSGGDEPAAGDQGSGCGCRTSGGQPLPGGAALIFAAAGVLLAAIRKKKGRPRQTT